MNAERKGLLFQDIILRLQQYWAEYGCIITQPYNAAVGAGTFNPSTFLRSLGPEPWKVAYVEPSRRPKDGRYGENPIRMQQFLQYQVLLKPPPDDVLDVYFASLETVGIVLKEHDVRLVKDDWESPTLGAAGLGWEIWIDGMEITQFTYFQQVGGFELTVPSVEITYGLGRLGTFLQGVESFFELEWAPGVSFGEIQKRLEVDFSRYHFEEADVPFHRELFDKAESEAHRLFELNLLGPAYEYLLLCSHTFNVLDARGAISVTERTGYIARVRKIARKAAVRYVELREEIGFPLLPKDERPDAAGGEGDGAAGDGTAGDEAAADAPDDSAGRGAS